MTNPFVFDQFCSCSPQVKKVICCQERRGLGVENDPVRMIPMMFTLDGQLLASGDDDLNPRETNSCLEERIKKQLKKSPHFFEILKSIIENHERKSN